MKIEDVFLLWDCSRLWGLMAWKTLKAAGLKPRLAKAKDIAQPHRIGKRRQSLLVVPGGPANQKFNALGKEGSKNLRLWIAEGNLYLGICGGAGLALKNGLALCGWERDPYENRLHHLLSGHVLAKCQDREERALPVWWPGRFACASTDGIEILARYASPGEDLWLSDLPLSKMPQAFWTKFVCRNDSPAAFHFPLNQPLAITGMYGKGRFVLSYAHLETPGSFAANKFLWNTLSRWTDLEGISEVGAVWDTLSGKQQESSSNSGIAIIKKMRRDLLELVDCGIELGWLFKRKSWLLGWRPGFPGMILNHLLAFFEELSFAESGLQTNLWLEKREKELVELFCQFIEAARDFFWQARILQTLKPAAANRETLFAASKKYFGHPMHGGGLAEELLLLFDELFYEQNRRI